ncbi:hypothetical protein EIZ48_04485 [Photobacterium alginatilyticum]|uniref:Uncharacterized protein n=1 Tax=Photobacterium alginatilyticum TaxID=1775171 RepID=A0ABW9YDJ3_9GAMM|nr:hypothetical protein [Photobacterium alginatilyticum]
MLQHQCRKVIRRHFLFASLPSK